MKTTKFGLKISLFAAILYLGALQSPLIPLLMLGYILLAEDGEEVRKMACQAILILGGLWLLDGVYDTITQLVSFLNTFVGNGMLHMPYGLSAAVWFVEDAVPVVFAVLALLGRYAMVSPASLEQAVKKAQTAAKAAPADETKKEDTKE